MTKGRRDKKPYIEVVPGQIRVSTVSVLRDTEDILIIECDLNSKYAGTMGYSTGPTGDGIDIMLWAGPETLRTDTTTDQPTHIILPPKTEGWHIVTDWARYTFRAVAYMDIGFYRQVWKSKS